jgi:hypothetical protein
MVPFPLPLAPEVIVIQDTFDAADQEQPLAAVTDMPAVLPAPVTVCDTGDTP